MYFYVNDFKFHVNIVYSYYKLILCSTHIFEKAGHIKLILHFSENLGLIFKELLFALSHFNEIVY